tara:strand:- start:89 stop:373 length:285 start_codon:yes stop_codon:yes gene_type:complete
MQKIYLKFKDTSECASIIGTTNYKVDDRKTFVCWGELAKETGETATDSNGNEYPVMVPVSGYHVDMYIEDGLDTPSELVPYVVATPDNPIHTLR